MDLQKDLINILTQKKQIFCTDLTLDSTITLTDYSIQSGTTTTTTATLVTILPSEIIDANENEITLNSNITLKTPDIIEGTPPNQTTTPGDIIICNEILKIPLNSETELGLDYRSLIGRTIEIISSDTVSFSINLNSIIINQSVNINYKLIKDVELESIFNNFLNSLNSENPKQLIKFDFPVNNDFFKKYDDFTDVMIGYKSCYKIETDINDKVGHLNNFLMIDIDSFVTKSEYINYYNNYIEKITLIYETVDSWVEYFKRLKKLMSKIRIADALVEEEECQNLYDSKPQTSREEIDNMYNIYLENNREMYIENKQNLLFNIKI